MNNKTKQLQKSDQNQIAGKKETTALAQYLGSSIFIPKTKVTLNFWAIGLFGFSFFCLGVYWAGFQKAPQVDLSQVEGRQQKILELLATQNNRPVMIKKENHADFIKKTVEELKELMEKKEQGEKQLLVEQQQEIESLKQKLRTMAEIRPNLDRRPGSIKKKKTIPYNKKNASVLYYEQKLTWNSYMKRFKKEQEDFVANSDMSDPENQKTFELMKQNHKLSLHELEAEHDASRLEFSRNKFRVIN